MDHRSVLRRRRAAAALRRARVRARLARRRRPVRGVVGRGHRRALRDARADAGGGRRRRSAICACCHVAEGDLGVEVLGVVTGRDAIGGVMSGWEAGDAPSPTASRGCVIASPTRRSTPATPRLARRRRSPKTEPSRIFTAVASSRRPGPTRPPERGDILDGSRTRAWNRRTRGPEEPWKSRSGSESRDGGPTGSTTSRSCRAGARAIPRTSTSPGRSTRTSSSCR